MVFKIDALVAKPVQGAMPTAIPAVSEGEYTARVDDLQSGQTVESWFRELKTKNGDRLVLDIPFLILDENAKKEVGRDRIVIRKTCWLDLDAEGGLMVADDKNVDLGKVREPLGLNDPKKPFSFSMLPGAGPVKVKVTQRSAEDDPRTKYNDIVRITAVS